MRLEQIDEFRWRLPRAGRHAGGRDRLRRRAADGRHPGGSQPHAGAERRAPPRDRGRLARDAGHPLGLRLSDRRRGCDGRRRGRRLAGRRGLRHQLRCAAAALEAHARGGGAPHAGGGRRAVQARADRRRERARRPDPRAGRLRQRPAGRCGAGPSGAGSARRPTSTTSKRAAACRTPTPASCRDARGNAAGRSSGRSARAITSRRSSTSPRSSTSALRERFGLRRDQITVMIHSGSRGLGHQVCDDHLRVMIAATRKYGIELPDRQLCCAPVGSPEGQRYLAAMARRRQLRLCQPPGDDALDPREPDARARRVARPGGHRDALRRVPQHRQVRDASSSTARRGACASIGRAPRGPTRPGTPRRRPRTATWASR